MGLAAWEAAEPEDSGFSPAQPPVHVARPETRTLSGAFGGGGMDGLNMAAIMASMAVGGAVGQNIAGTMNNMMGGINQQVSTSTVPPPIPVVTYHVAISGQAAGPFDIDTIKQMVISGQINKDSLVWKPGMSEWTKAEIVEEISSLFLLTPPAL